VKARLLASKQRLFATGRVAAVVAVVALCLWFVRRVDWRLVGEALRGADLPLVLLAAAINFVLLYAKAERWRLLLSPLRAVPRLRLFSYLLVGQGASIVLPGRAGDVLRVVWLERRERVPMLSSAGSVVAEKLFEGLGLLAIVLPLPLLLPLPRWVAGSIALVALAGGVGTLAVGHFVRSVRQPRLFFAATGWSVVSHLLDAVEVWLIMTALHVGAPWPAALLVLLTLNFAIAAPSTPGQLGAFEAGAVAGLRLAGVESEAAVAFALVYHLAQALPTLLAALNLWVAARAAQWTGASSSPAPPGGRDR
jgi:uncharacterized membrane protein YbhN (UPF0104 family)